jgi:hypothetical protein
VIKGVESIEQAIIVPFCEESTDDTNKILKRYNNCNVKLKFFFLIICFYNISIIKS